MKHSRQRESLPVMVPWTYDLYHPHVDVADLFQGTSVKTGTCETCGLSQQHCIGHFGFVKLTLPLFHIGYFKNTLTICQCICKVTHFMKQSNLAGMRSNSPDASTTATVPERNSKTKSILRTTRCHHAKSHRTMSQSPKMSLLQPNQRTSKEVCGSPDHS